jgi:hypothetical protein
MACSAHFVSYVRELLWPLRAVALKCRFSSHGVYPDRVSIAISAGDQFCLKTDSIMHAAFECRRLFSVRLAQGGQAHGDALLPCPRRSAGRAALDATLGAACIGSCAARPRHEQSARKRTSGLRQESVRAHNFPGIGARHVAPH